jgi:hypothetical protein
MRLIVPVPRHSILRDSNINRVLGSLPELVEWLTVSPSSA